MKRKQPKFRVGQVVAWTVNGAVALAYYQVSSFFFDQEDELRYKFRHTDSVASALCPIESCVRALTPSEIDPRPARRKGKGK